MRFPTLIVLAAAAWPANASEQETVTQTISFKGCISAAHELADQIGVELVRTLDGPSVKIFEVRGSDGTITVICSAKERKMVLSRTSNR